MIDLLGVVQLALGALILVLFAALFVCGFIFNRRLRAGQVLIERQQQPETKPVQKRTTTNNLPTKADESR